MAILVIRVPVAILEEACYEPNGESASFVRHIQDASDEYHETGKLTLILPSEEDYEVICEGEGKITEFRIESSDK